MNRYDATMISLFMIAAAIMGCGRSGPIGPERQPTEPLTGVVHVDGQPAEALQIQCHPVAGSSVVSTISGYTDAEGRFSIGTYESADGIPAGSYRLTFFWGQWNMSGSYGGPDRLKGRYAKAQSSTFEVVADASAAQDLGTISLSSKE